MQTLIIPSTTPAIHVYGNTFGKTILLITLFCLGSLHVFAKSSLESNPPVESCETCAIPGVTPQTFITGAHAVIYAGRLYDSVECKTYFLYCAVNDGGAGGSDISHTDFGDFSCGNTCLQSETQSETQSSLGSWSVDNSQNVLLQEACGEVEYGTDPNTGICGIKHDAESEGACYENETCEGGTLRVAHLYVAVDGNVAEGTLTLAYKFGNAVESLEIPGPGNCEDLGCPDLNPILPVHLVDFSVSKLGSSSLLTWTTASETNNDYFEILKADQKNNFVIIGKIRGAGNSQSPQHYTFTDASPYTGVNFYKLRQVDFDGHEIVSPIRIINFNSTVEISIFPNPATDQLAISFNDWDPQLPTTIKVLDVSGAEVYSEEVQSVLTNLTVAQLPAGTYFIHLTNNVTTEVYRFIKS